MGVLHSGTTHKSPLVSECTIQSNPPVSAINSTCCRDRQAIAAGAVGIADPLTINGHRYMTVELCGSCKRDAACNGKAPLSGLNQQLDITGDRDRFIHNKMLRRKDLYCLPVGCVCYSAL